jgi:large subunit ribosomal protein L29
MKYKDIITLTAAELNKKLAEEKETLGRLKFAHAITPIENPMKIREARKNIAVISTAITAKANS